MAKLVWLKRKNVEKSLVFIAFLKREEGRMAEGRNESSNTAVESASRCGISSKEAAESAIGSSIGSKGADRFDHCRMSLGSLRVCVNYFGIIFVDFQKIHFSNGL